MNIRHNYLNLPEVIQFGSGRGIKYIKFVYDATGVKLRKIIGMKILPMFT
jgi:hypothetical protein